MEALRAEHNDLEASRDFYAQLYDLAPFANLRLNYAGVIRNLNLAAAKLLNRQREDLVHTPFRLVLLRRDQRRFLGLLRELRGGTGRLTAELTLHPKNQPPLRVQVQMVAWPASGMGAKEFWVAVLDTGERRKATARTAALAKLGLLLSGATDARAAARAVVDVAQEYCGWDACFLLLYSPATDKLWQLINMDIIRGRRQAVPPILDGKPPTPLIRRVLQEGPQLILRQQRDLAKVDTTPFGDAARLSRSLMFVPVRLQDQCTGVLSVQTYQANAYAKEDLEVLQGLADHAGGALARLQAQDALKQLTGQLEQRVIERTAELRDYQEHLEDLVRERTGQLETANQELRQEVSARKAAEEDLRRVALELQRSNEDLEQFAYVVSHDLQEPLRAVGGYVRLLEMRFPEMMDEKVREFIAGAAEGATRMEQQLSALLNFSRVGKQGLLVAQAGLDELLQEALDNLQYSIETSKATIRRDPLPTLTVDKAQFVQLFQNLIGNALKFRSERRPVIHVGARAEPGRWVIWVKDNGIGIDPEHRGRIFQVFQRLHTRRQYPGTGIGLAICQKIMQRHGGSIWVESAAGQGATFFFSIPQPSAILPSGK